jgi:hypothetical protein
MTNLFNTVRFQVVTTYSVVRCNLLHIYLSIVDLPCLVIQVGANIWR